MTDAGLVSEPPEAVGGLGGRCPRPEPVMTLPRSVADVLDRHVMFEIESIDRIYLNVYQPRLQYPKGAAAFFHFHRGHTFASSALMAQMTKAFVTAVYEVGLCYYLRPGVV